MVFIRTKKMVGAGSAQ